MGPPEIGTCLISWFQKPLMIHLSSILNRSSPPDRLRTPCCLQLDYPERCTSLVSHLFYSRKWGEQNQQSQSRVLHKKRWAAGNLRVAHWSKSHRANTLGCWKWNGEKYFSQGLINCEVPFASPGNFVLFSGSICIVDLETISLMELPEGLEV